MKKLFAFICVLILFACMLTSCQMPALSNTDGKDPESEEDQKTGMVFGKKYYRLNPKIDKNIYFVLYEDGTGVFKYEALHQNVYGNNVKHIYKDHLVWDGDSEEGIIAVTNGTEYSAGHSAGEPDGGHTYVCTIIATPSFIMVSTSSSVNYYVCEDRVADLTNMGKVIEEEQTTN